MKIIDLLNKIANGEKIPEYATYYNKNENMSMIMLLCKENIIYRLNEDAIDLNDEVETIEEEKKIPEKLDQTLNRIDIGEDYYRYIMENRFKINKIIDYLDYLKSKGE